MLNSFKNISLLLFILAVISLGTLSPGNSYAEMGADIIGANCNPGADPALDYIKTDPNLKSCIGQGIQMSDYKVKVSFDGHGAFAGAYTAICTYFANKSSFDPLFQVVFIATCGGLAANSATVDIAAGHAVNVLRSTFNTPLIIFDSRIEGDKLCIYSIIPPPLIGLAPKAERTAGYNAAYGVTGSSKAERLPSHCVYMPEPIPASKPAVPNFISQTCVDYDTTASQFKWPASGARDSNGNPLPAKTRSFTGVVVQCIEETMNNLFFNTRGTQTETIFQKTQKQLTNILKAMLVLYVVFLGFKYVMEPGAIKQNDFIWIALKISLIFYFAAGPGVTKFLPGIIGSVKEASSIMLDAATGNGTSNKADAEAKLLITSNDYNDKKAAYAAARSNWGRYTTTTIGYTEAEKNRRKVTMDDAKVAQDKAHSIYEKARMATVSYGYNYCNFQPFAEAGKYNYTIKVKEKTIAPANTVPSSLVGTEIPAGGLLTTDMSYMKLWDSIDCRIAKYLGIGAIPDSPSSPHSLLIAIGSLLSGPVGIIIFCLLVTFLVFVVLIIIRMVHIYIIAFMALILLAYIAPLVIPMALFEHTKSSFDAWLKQVIGFAVQPIILFAFLAFMFAIFDNIIYGGNYNFNPVDKSELVTSPDLSDNTITRIQDRNGNWKCPDVDTVGCIYEELAVDEETIEIAGAKIFSYYTLDWDNSRNNTLMVELLKVILACFVLHALLGQIEEFSKTLTNVVGGSASMSTMPTADPTKIANATAVPALKKLAGGVEGLVSNTFGIGANAAAKSAKRSELKKENK